MRIGWIAAVAVALTPVAAQAQSTLWRVLFAVPGAAVFVPGNVAGTGDRRTLTTLIVLSKPNNGSDVEYNDWVVECATLSIQLTGGRAFLGTTKVRDTAGEAMTVTEERTLDRAIAEYACTGKNESGDASTFASDTAAIDYGRRASK